jgi:hypothetical protein
LRSTNFVSFITVQGFILGIVFSILKTNTPEDLLTYTILITLFFYLFAHLSVAFYLHTMEIKTNAFPMHVHEKDLDTLMHEIIKREKFIDSVYEEDSVSDLEKQEISKIKSKSAA